MKGNKNFPHLSWQSVTRCYMQLCVDTSTSQYHSWRFMYLSNQILWVSIKDFLCWCIPGFVTDVLDISHHPSPPTPQTYSILATVFVPFITCQDKVYVPFVPLCRAKLRFDTHTLKDRRWVWSTDSFCYLRKQTEQDFRMWFEKSEMMSRGAVEVFVLLGQGTASLSGLCLMVKTMWSYHICGSNVQWRIPSFSYSYPRKTRL